uniref:RRM domain-containing protein n=1 Tax=Steinernema glaseri TaxID=37863 RepID=A0A1I7YTG4_9BILA
MVKLFVGNLADSVDSFRLRNLFLEYVDAVQECDVLKNYAFVHVVSERDAETVISKLDRYNLEGKEIHIERSTSRLRKEPGMGDKCFTCGKSDHKTPNCPQEMERRMRMGDAKPPMKRERTGSPHDGPPSKITVNLCPPSNTYGYTPSNGSVQGQVQSSNPVDHDPELPRPADPDLQQIYQQYIEARQRYFYYRDRLGKELSLRPAGGASQHTSMQPVGSSVNVAAAPPVNYASAQQTYQPPSGTGYTPGATSHPYGGGSTYYQQQQPQQQAPPQQQQQPYAPSATPAYAASAPSHPYQQAPQQHTYGYQAGGSAPVVQQRAPYYAQSSSASTIAGSNTYAQPSSGSQYGPPVTNLTASSNRQTIGSFPPQPTRR